VVEEGREGISRRAGSRFIMGRDEAEAGNRCRYRLEIRKVTRVVQHIHGV
jgi:hypothetical protein